MPREPSVTFDTELPGLALHIAPKRAFWTFTYSPHGMNPSTGKRWGLERLELGDVGVTTLPEARRLALAAKAAVKARTGPAARETAARASSSAARGMARPVSATAGEALDLYEAALVTAPTETARRKSSEKTRKQAVAYARKAVWLMHVESLCPDAIDAAAVRRMLDCLDASDAERRHVFGGLHGLWRGAASAGLAAVNPATALTGTNGRSQATPATTLPISRRCATSGARSRMRRRQIRDLAHFSFSRLCALGEASGLRWGEVDLERGWIRIDGARMKNGESHELPLSEPRAGILTGAANVARSARQRDGASEQRGRSACVPDAGSRRGAPELDPPHSEGQARDRTRRLTAGPPVPLARHPPQLRHALWPRSSTRRRSTPCSRTGARASLASTRSRDT